MLTTVTRADDALPTPPDTIAVDSVASDTTVADSTIADSAAVTQPVVLPADTIKFNRVLPLGRTVPVTDSTNFETYLYQNPTVALFKSMAVPGWGQFGNRSYRKALLFFGLDAWFVLSAIHYGRKASDHFDNFEAASDIPLRNEYYGLYESQRDQRNKFTWFAVIVTFIAMFDAYVDAHLSGFPAAEAAERISIEVGADDEQTVAATVSVSF